MTFIITCTFFRIGTKTLAGCFKRFLSLSLVSTHWINDISQLLLWKFTIPKSVLTHLVHPVLFNPPAWKLPIHVPAVLQPTCFQLYCL